MSINKAIIIGHLTRDPEFKVLPSGMQVCRFTVATNKRIKNQPDEVNFVEITAWGKNGEFVSKYFKKGKAILVEGFLRLESWMSKEGEQRTKIVIIAEEVGFVGNREEENSTQESLENEFAL